MPFTIKKIDPFSFAGSGKLRKTIEVEIPYGNLQHGQVLQKGLSFTDYIELATGGTIIPEPDPIIPDPDPDPIIPDPDPDPDPDPEPGPVQSPTLTNRNLVFNPLVQGLAEVGEVVALNITGSFNRGTIMGALVAGVWSPSTQQGFRAGPVQSYEIIANGSNLGSQGNTLPFVVNVPVQANQNVIVLRANYAEGDVALNSDGSVFATALPAGDTQQTRTFQGAFPIFATSIDTLTMTKQPLVPHSSEEIFITVAAETAQNKHAFWLPTSVWQLVSVQYLDPATGQYNPADQSGQYNVTQETLSINGNSQIYMKYTNASFVTRVAPVQMRITVQ